MDIIERLEQLEDLVATTKPLRPHAANNQQEVTCRSMRNQKRLRYLKAGIDKAFGMVRFLEPMPDLDVCLVEKSKKDIDVWMKRLSNIVEDILSLPEDDTASLNEAASMEDELRNMTLKLIKLSHNQEHRIMEEVTSSGLRLPKISIPMFIGKF